MSFNIGLSGLYAANKQLDVTGNNIANVNTVGFKSSRAEFADVYAGANRLGVGKNQVGNGVRLAAVSQQFSQGDINNTGNVLDMGIQGRASSCCRTTARWSIPVPVPSRPTKTTMWSPRTACACKAMPPTRPARSRRAC